MYKPELNKQDTLNEYYQAIGKAKDCHFNGDNNGVRFWRKIASQYQKDITYYLMKELNKPCHE